MLKVTIILGLALFSLLCVGFVVWLGRLILPDDPTLRLVFIFVTGFLIGFTVIGRLLDYLMR